MRWGYEPYSFHSQYNLLTAAKLAVAYTHADNSIHEAPCPADIGSFVVPILMDFHKLFANAGGTYIEIDTDAHGHYNPTGLLRVHRRGVAPQIGPSDGSIVKKTYQTPRPTAEALSICPGWKGNDGHWHKLADYTDGAIRNATVRIVKEVPSVVELEVIYSGDLHGCTRITQRYRIRPESIEVNDQLEGDIVSMRQYFPLLVFDGERETEITISGKTAEVRLADSSQSFHILNDGELKRLNIREPFRNGELDATYVELKGKQGRFVIRPVYTA